MLSRPLSQVMNCVPPAHWPPLQLLQRPSWQPKPPQAGGAPPTHWLFAHVSVPLQKLPSLQPVGAPKKPLLRWKGQLNQIPDSSRLIIT